MALVECIGSINQIAFEIYLRQGDRHRTDIDSDNIQMARHMCTYQTTRIFQILADSVLRHPQKAESDPLQSIHRKKSLWKPALSSITLE